MPDATISARCPGRIRETVPCLTLLTYFVPSSRITSPSFPGSIVCSVFRSVPSGPYVSTLFESTVTTTMLPWGSKAMPLGRASKELATKTEDWPRDVIRYTRQLVFLRTCEGCRARPHDSLRSYGRVARQVLLVGENADRRDLGVHTVNRLRPSSESERRSWSHSDSEEGGLVELDGALGILAERPGRVDDCAPGSLV